MSDLEVFLGRPGTPASEGLEQDSALLVTASDASEWQFYDWDDYLTTSTQLTVLQSGSMHTTHQTWNKMAGLQQLKQACTWIRYGYSY